MCRSNKFAHEAKRCGLYKFLMFYIQWLTLAHLSQWLKSNNFCFAFLIFSGAFEGIPWEIEIWCSEIWVSNVGREVKWNGVSLFSMITIWSRYTITPPCWMIYRNIVKSVYKPIFEQHRSPEWLNTWLSTIYVTCVYIGKKIWHNG